MPAKQTKAEKFHRDVHAAEAAPIPEFPAPAARKTTSRQDLLFAVKLFSIAGLVILILWMADRALR